MTKKRKLRNGEWYKVFPREEDFRYLGRTSLNLHRFARLTTTDDGVSAVVIIMTRDEGLSFRNRKCITISGSEGMYHSDGRLLGKMERSYFNQMASEVLSFHMEEQPK